MRTKFLVPVFMITIATMVACGDDTPDPPNSVPEKSNQGGDWVVSFTVEEDGKSYRCFHSIDYRGGLWCTEREGF